MSDQFSGYDDAAVDTADEEVPRDPEAPLDAEVPDEEAPLDEPGEAVPVDDPVDEPVEADGGAEGEALRTGNPAVDEVLESVEALDGRPAEEHVEVFERAHEKLRGALDGSQDS